MTVAEWDNEPLIPLIETCLLPTDVNVHDRLEEPDPVTLAGLRVQKDVVFVARLTIPLKPFRAAMLMVDVPAEFTLTTTLVGFAAIVKSRTTNVTGAV